MMKIGVGAAIVLAVVMIGLGLFPAAGTPGERGHPSAPRAAPHGARERIQPGGVWVRTSLTAWTNALVVGPHGPDQLVAGTANGAWLSTDSGVTWRRDGDGLDGVSILALATASARHTLFAGAVDGAVYARSARPGSGRRWQRISPRLGPDPIISVAVAPRASSIVLAGTIGSLYRGENTGRGWRWRRVARVGDAAITSITWEPGSARLVLASVFAHTPPVLLSRDAGRTWHAGAWGLPAILPTETLLAATSAPSASRVVLSTMGGGVWQRSSAGRWRDASTGLPERHAMALVAAPEPWHGEPLLYAGTMGFGVYGKMGAAPWRRLGRGLSGAAYTVLALALTPGAHPTLFAATAYGVFRYAPPA